MNTNELIFFLKGYLEDKKSLDQEELKFIKKNLNEVSLYINPWILPYKIDHSYPQYYPPLITSSGQINIDSPIDKPRS